MPLGRPLGAGPGFGMVGPNTGPEDAGVAGIEAEGMEPEGIEAVAAVDWAFAAGVEWARERTSHAPTAINTTTAKPSISLGLATEARFEGADAFVVRALDIANSDGKIRW
jgi:hypothetical protein